MAKEDFLLHRVPRRRKKTDRAGRPSFLLYARIDIYIRNGWVLASKSPGPAQLNQYVVAQLAARAQVDDDDEFRLGITTNRP